MDELIRKSFKKYPHLMIENTDGVHVVGAVLSVVGAGVQYLLLGFSFIWWWSVLILILYVLSRVADMVSTLQTTALKPDFDKRGMEFPVYESNENLPDYPTRKDLLFGKTTLSEIFLGGVAFLIPGAGIFFSGVFFLVAWSNYRITQRLTFMLNS